MHTAIDSRAEGASSLSADISHNPRFAKSQAKILAAATELLVEAGPRAVTVDAVSERSGVAKSTLYRHWTSINDLLVDVVRSNVPRPAQVSLGDGFEAALRAHIDGAVETLSRPEWSRILPALIELRRHRPELHALFDADREAEAAALSSVLALGVAEGVLPEGLDTQQVSHVLLGPLFLATLAGDSDDIAGLAAFVIDRFLASYRAT